MLVEKSQLSKPLFSDTKISFASLFSLFLFLFSRRRRQPSAFRGQRTEDRGGALINVPILLSRANKSTFCVNAMKKKEAKRKYSI